MKDRQSASGVLLKLLDAICEPVGGGTKFVELPLNRYGSYGGLSRRLVVGYKDPDCRSGNKPAFVLKDAESLLRGPERDGEVISELAIAGEPLARLAGSASDLPFDRVGNPLVYGKTRGFRLHSPRLYGPLTLIDLGQMGDK
jgi:hypothetical protein